MDATDTPSARAREIGRLVRAQILTFGPLGPASCLVILNSEWALWRTVRLKLETILTMLTWHISIQYQSVKFSSLLFCQSAIT